MCAGQWNGADSGTVEQRNAQAAELRGWRRRATPDYSSQDTYCTSAQDHERNAAQQVHVAPGSPVKPPNDVLSSQISI